VADGESGFLVPARDPGAFAERLGVLLDNPAAAERMGRRGREVYLERFTEDRYREGLQRALLTLVDEGER
jgi:glycosyltransferase involved in cell wall biosynthesis